MNRFLKKIGIFLITIMLVDASAAQESQTFLYLLYDGGRVGEKNQVLGVARFLKEYLPEDTVRKEFELKDQEEFLLDVRQNLTEEPNNKGIVVAAEVESIGIIKQFKPQPNIVIAHSSHQYTKDHAGLKGVADIVALPQYVVTDEVREAIESPPHTILVQTAGVAHNLSLKDIQEAYEGNKDRLPVAPAYLGVILGGDAETPDKKLFYYTAAEAAQMADYIAPLMKEKKAHLLILNGPRTGKHDQTTGEVIKTSHRDGQPDAITQAFMKRLQEQGRAPDQDFTLFDFQFGKPSAYPVVLGVLHATKSPIFVAGESTSMVSETADCLPGLATAYTNGAMNENHRKHCASEQEAGRIRLLENNKGEWRLLEAAAASSSKDSRPASRIIAEAVQKRCEEKFPK